MEDAGLGFGVCPSVRAPADPQQKPAVTAGKGKGEKPDFPGGGHPVLATPSGANGAGEQNTRNRKKPYSVGMIKSTDELAAGEQSGSFWLAALERGGQPWGGLLFPPPVEQGMSPGQPWGSQPGTVGSLPVKPTSRREAGLPRKAASSRGQEGTEARGNLGREHPPLNR